MKRIMTPRAAAVAFAASALVAAPALADPGKGAKHDHNKRHASSALHLDVGNGLSVTLANGDWALGHNGRYGHRGGHGYGSYGNRSWYQTRQLRRDAVRACAEAVRRTSNRAGFRRVYLDDVEGIRQIGPYGFKVRAEFEFEGRRRDFERDVTCTVRRGNVVNIDNMPERRGYYGYGYGNQGYGYPGRDYRNDGHRGNDHLKGGQHRGY